MNNKYSGFVSIWIVILIIELFWFSGLINRVHDQEEVLFIMTIVFVTLIVGAVLLLLAAIKSKKH
jgi:hypothetical protein